MAAPHVEMSRTVDSSERIHVTASLPTAETLLPLRSTSPPRDLKFRLQALHPSMRGTAPLLAREKRQYFLIGMYSAGHFELVNDEFWARTSEEEFTTGLRTLGWKRESGGCSWRKGKKSITMVIHHSGGITSYETSNDLTVRNHFGAFSYIEIMPADLQAAFDAYYDEQHRLAHEQVGADR